MGVFMMTLFRSAGVMTGLLFALLLSSGVNAAQTLNAREILTRMEATMRGDASYFEMSMSIVRPRYSREVQLKSWSMGDDFSLTLITAPARDQGTVFLKREREIWNYVPNIDRTIKMPPSMMSQSWMGSDFTNDDLVRESSVIDDYEHQILREEIYEDHKVWVLELIPKPDTAIVWGRVRMWISQQHYLQLRIENDDQSNQLANTMELSDIQLMGGRLLPTLMKMTPADKPDHHTLMRYLSVEFDPPLDASFFTRQNMQRVR